MTIAEPGPRGISIRSISKRYGSFTALDSVSLDLTDGGFTVLLGPSGSGKTTLLSILGGFTVPDEGAILINGKDVTMQAPALRPTTTVFQDYALFPHMSVGANVAFGLRMRGMTLPDRNKKASSTLALVGLADAFEKKPHQLSGGQRQRVALARALAVDPDVLLLDEPLGALDLKLRRQMQDELKLIQRRVGTTFVHVTHDQEEAMAIADRIIVLNKGRIVDDGAPDRVYLKPRSTFGAEFMGVSTLLAGVVHDLADTTITIATALGPLALPVEGNTVFPVGTSVFVSLRPEDILSGAEEGTISLGTARVDDCTFLGVYRKVVACHVQDASFRPSILLPHHRVVHPGDLINLHVRPGSIGLIPQN